MTLVPGEEGTFSATCTSGGTLVSGGFLMNRPGVQILLNSRGATPNTWVVTARNTSLTENATISAVAQCAP
ncbi:hypothetical protein ACFXA3_14055 [Streptomyces sp. NPDC059456]|uniref:hypothetical protein n=1 Tax=Streptomyces sp. NPDC059456 TaxID=3346838 RepID=UPI0036A70271